MTFCGGYTLIRQRSSMPPSRPLLLGSVGRGAVVRDVMLPNLEYGLGAIFAIELASSAANHDVALRAGRTVRLPVLTPSQEVVAGTFNASLPDFAVTRRLAMRFRGTLRGRDVAKLDAWLTDAYHSGIYGMRRFARTLRGDLDAARNAVTEPWSNGQTEGQITRLKMLKRAMYRRAGTRLLRARLLPLRSTP